MVVLNDWKVPLVILLFSKPENMRQASLTSCRVGSKMRLKKKWNWHLLENGTKGDHTVPKSFLNVILMRRRNCRTWRYFCLVTFTTGKNVTSPQEFLKAKKNRSPSMSNFFSSRDIDVNIDFTMGELFPPDPLPWIVRWQVFYEPIKNVVSGREISSWRF